MSKRLAIHLYGMIRTYERTYESFLKNIIEANKKDGWEIDIFMHTWNIFNQVDPSTWHKNNNYFPTMNGKKLSQSDILNIKRIYSPTKFKIDEDTRDYGRYESIKRAMMLRVHHENENNIKYDWYLTTRTDIFFLNPLKISNFIDFYNRNPEFKVFKIPEKINFCLTHAFREGRIEVIDPRHPNESDILWFSNYCSNNGMEPLIAYSDKSIINVFIKYQLDVDCFQIRETTKNISPKMIVKKNEIDKLESCVNSSNQQIQVLTNEKNSLQNEITSLQTQIAKLQNSLNSISTKKANLEVLNLEQDLKIKELQVLKIKKDLGKKFIQNTYITLINTNSAKARIHSHLSYKLGTALIANSKSILGYIKMPYILMAITIAHKEQNKNLKLVKDKFPPLESYPDYKEALKEKECFTYKLGEAFIKAHENWYKGGYIMFLFEIYHYSKQSKQKDILC